MKHFYTAIVLAICMAHTVFACKITIVNDTESTIFAFDDGFNEGNILTAGKQTFYGEKGRHPSVTLYIAVMPQNDTFKKSYNITQLVCASTEEDKVVSVSAVIAGTFDKDIYKITNFTGMELPSCCAHNESHMGHAEETVDRSEVVTHK